MIGIDLFNRQMPEDVIDRVWGIRRESRLDEKRREEIIRVYKGLQE